MPNFTENEIMLLNRLAFNNHDKCMLCGYNFQMHRNTILGFGINKQPYHLCERCASEMIMGNSIIRTYTPRPYTAPPKINKLWRYMDFTKYVSMLSNSKLYFARIDKLHDPLEGAFCSLSKENDYRNHHLCEIEKELSKGLKPKSKSVVRTMAKARYLRESEDNFIDRNLVFVNCWHENDHESEAMWRLYSGHLQYAVAITTTSSKLFNLLNINDYIHIGEVKYTTYEQVPLGGYSRYWYKSKSFEHEKEVRAMIIKDDIIESRHGIEIDCSLSELIQEVYISPQAEPWFFRLVQTLTSIFKYKFNIVKSELGQPASHKLSDYKDWD